MEEFDFVDISFEKEQKLNFQLSAPAKRPELRDKIYAVIQELPEEQVLRQYCSRLTFRENVSLAVKQYLPVAIVKWIRKYF